MPSQSNEGFAGQPWHEQNTTPGVEMPTMVREVCSPIYQYFPPAPTRCLFCGNTTRAQCPLDREG